MGRAFNLDDKKNRRSPRGSFTKAGPVKITNTRTGEVTIEAPYDKEQLKRIHRGGRGGS